MLADIFVCVLLTVNVGMNRTKHQLADICMSVFVDRKCGNELNKGRTMNDFGSNATDWQSTVPCSLAMRLSVSVNESPENDRHCRIALH